jgi:hypothetical protein
MSAIQLGRNPAAHEQEKYLPAEVISNWQVFNSPPRAIRSREWSLLAQFERPACSIR